MDVLGVRCWEGNPELAAAAVVSRAQGGKGGYACLGNVHVVVSAQRDATLRASLNDAWAVFPDGAPIAWLARALGSTARRVAGADLMVRVVEIGRQVGLRHYLYGSSELVVEQLHTRLLSSYPGAVIVGAVAPPVFALSEVASDPNIDLICDARPDVVWCALGAPKQELWMNAHASRLAPALAVGVGAAFDFLTGTKQRAPAWMQRAGLEWLHRLIQEPGRLGRRYLTTNADFVVRAAVELARRGRS